MRPYVRAANIGWDGWKLDDVKEMDFTSSEVEIYQLRHGDILLNEASGSPTEVGKPAIWTGAIEGCCFQNTLLRVRLHDKRLIKLVYFTLLHDALQNRFGEGAEGTNIQHIGQKRLSTWKIPLIPLAETARICEVFETLDHRSNAETGALQALRETRSALMSVLLTGELRVTPS